MSYSDPYVFEIEVGEEILTSAELTPELLGSMDCIVILTNHSAFDYSMIAAASSIILDCRNSLREFSGSNIVSL